MSTLLIGIPQNLFSNAAASVANSTAYGLPPRASLIQWQTLFGTAPASVTIQIQTSLNGVDYNTEASTTVVGGATGSFVTSALKVRARINAISGGANVTVIVNAKSTMIDQTVDNSIVTNEPAGSEHDVQLCGSAGDFAAVTNGTTGQVLTATTGAAPTFQNAAAGGITTLTGDVTAGPGSGSVAATLAAGSASVLNSGTLPTARLATPIKTRPITFAIDGGGSVLTTGVKAEVYIPYACTITAVTLVADQAGDVELDILAATYADFPTVGSIVASAPPVLSNAQKSQDTTLTGWTTSIAAGTVLQFEIVSVADITRLNCVLTVTL